MNEPMNVVNGVNVEHLVATVKAIEADPSLAKFNFRSTTEWSNGGQSHTQIQSFYGAGQEDQSRTASFEIDSDEPPVLLGTNKGPNAVELVLSALASCLSVGFAYNAAVQGIKLEHLSFHVEGDIDLHGFLGLSDQVRPGYNNIRVRCEIKSGASAADIQKLSEHVQRTSPVLDILRQAVPVYVAVET